MTFTYPSAADLEHQLTALLTVTILDPLETWLDNDQSVHEPQREALSQVSTWRETLLGANNDDAVHAIVQLIAIFYPSDQAFTPPLNWWATPLGRVTAYRFGHPGATAVSYATAGAMLGISRQGVHDLVKRRKLTLHPEGGVSTSAIQQRLTQVVAATSLGQFLTITEQYEMRSTMSPAGNTPVITDTFVQSEIARVAVREFIPSSPTRSFPIVLLHGLGGTLADWNSMARTLARRRRVVAIDLRGSGYSDNAPWDRDAVLDDLEAVVKQLQLVSPIIVGWSLGGMVAALWGLRHPEAAAVINLDGHPVPGPPHQYEGLDLETVRSRNDQLRQYFTRMLPAQSQILDEDTVKQMVEHARSSAENEESAAWAEEAIRRRLRTCEGGWTMRADIEFLEQVRADLEQLDLVSVYKESKARTIVVLATEDMPGQEEFADLNAAHRRGLTRDIGAIASQKDSLTLVSLAGADHRMVTTHMDQIVELIQPQP